MPDPGPGAQIRAAGALLWRPAAGGVEVALVHRSRYDDWSLPKGKREPGEHILLTAAREVAEETGVAVVIGRPLGSTRYLSDGRPKRVDYWAARPADGAGARPFTPTHEVDGLEWLAVAAARDRLSYPHDVAVLEEFAAGPAVTTALVLVRHAAAQSRTAWRQTGHPSDLARPLTRRGREQAGQLADLFACYPPARVISSAAERCLATVRPYAARTAVPLTAEPAFTLSQRGAGDHPGEGGPSRDAAGVAAPGRDGPGDGERWTASVAARLRISGIVADGRPAVVCAHRQNLPALLAWACERLGAPVPVGQPLRKGAFWVLHTGGGTLVAAEQHQLAGPDPAS